MARSHQIEDDRAVLIAALRRQLGRAVAEKRWHFASHFCERILAEDPRDLEMWLLRGYLAWHHLGDTPKAVESFRKVLILGAYESSNAFVQQARAALGQLLEQLS